MPRTGKQARTMARELNQPLDVVLAAAGKPDGNERTVVDPDAVRAALGSTPSNNGSSTALVPVRKRKLTVPPVRRSKPTAQDREYVAWIRDRVKPIADFVSSLHGEPYRPHVEANDRGQMLYDDPINEGRKLRVSFQTYMVLKNNPTQDYPFVSPELKRQIVNRMWNLWFINRICTVCQTDMSDEVDHRIPGLVNALLDDSFELGLPNTVPYERDIARRFYDRHTECRELIKHMAKVEEVIQDAPGDDPHAIAYRKERYGEIVLQVLQDVISYRPHLKKSNIIDRMIMIQDLHGIEA